MNEFRFDGRVAIVTGAGRGIGRAHTLLLGARGASVVVNDLGGSMEGVGVDARPASSVAAEIVAAGGAAVGDSNDVSTEAGARAIVDAALDAFGRVDVVVNNAGIIRWADLPEADLPNLQHTLDVHLIGSFNVTRAAWPHMTAQKYGRVVMTTSTALFGIPGSLAYGTAKAGLIGLARNLRLSGAEHGITINLLAPAAFTRMVGGRTTSTASTPTPVAMSPDLVAPMMAYLCHESCSVNGEIYAAGGGRFSRIFIASTEGFMQLDPEPTIEDIAQNWSTINDESDYYVPSDVAAWSAEYMKHMRHE